MLYEQYDNKGNLLQYRKQDDIPTAYLWGYQQSYPIARITGATYAEVAQALGGDNFSLLGEGGQNLSKAQITLLKTQLSHAQISTYTYQPLTGMTSADDLNEQTIHYKYDALRRLKVIQDEQGNFINRFQYQYK